MPQLAIVEAFAKLAAPRRTAGQRHQQTLCLARCTLAVAAGHRGFLALGAWLQADHADLVALFQPPQNRLPSDSTTQRVLVPLDDREYAARLARCFDLQPLPGETIATAGKGRRGADAARSADPSVESHPAMLLVRAYLVARGLLLAPSAVDSKTNESTALPAFMAQLALKGVVWAFDYDRTIREAC